MLNFVHKPSLKDLTIRWDIVDNFEDTMFKQAIQFLLARLLKRFATKPGVLGTGIRDADCNISRKRVRRSRLLPWAASRSL